MKVRLSISLFLLTLLASTTATGRVAGTAHENRGDHLTPAELLPKGSDLAVAGNVDVDLTNHANSFYSSLILSSVAFGGTTTRVSVASDGTQGNDRSWRPSISADSRYVAFQSWASNLVPGDTNGTADAFIHDRQTGQTSRVSVASNGTQENDHSAAWLSMSVGCC